MRPKLQDGPGKYQLLAFISHMGASTMCTHYVCHIKKEGRWVIYNNQKCVPPKSHQGPGPHLLLLALTLYHVTQGTDDPT